MGPVRESNPGPLAPEARIIPLDQQAKTEVEGCKSGISKISLFRSSQVFWGIKEFFKTKTLLKVK